MRLISFTATVTPVKSPHVIWGTRLANPSPFAFRRWSSTASVGSRGTRKLRDGCTRTAPELFVFDPGCAESDVVVINVETGHRILPGTHAESKFLETADKVRIGC